MSATPRATRRRRPRPIIHFVDSSFRSEQRLRSEIECLVALQPSAYRHVANLIAVHESKYEVHIILHYCGGGSLQRLLKSLGYGSLGLDEAQAMVVLSQVRTACTSIHPKTRPTICSLARAAITRTLTRGRSLTGGGAC